jgi:hypothetical protein
MSRLSRLIGGLAGCLTSGRTGNLLKVLKALIVFIVSFPIILNGSGKCGAKELGNGGCD